MLNVEDSAWERPRLAGSSLVSCLRTVVGRSGFGVCDLGSEVSLFALFFGFVLIGIDSRLLMSTKAKGVISN